MLLPFLTIFMYATLSKETISNFFELDEILAKNDAIIAKMNARQKNYDDSEIKNFNEFKKNIRKAEDILEKREICLEKKEEILKNKELSLLAREENLRSEKENLIQDFCDGVKENFHISDLDTPQPNCWDSCSIL